MSSVLSSLLVLLAVAFFTLLERKCLGYIMLRKGPNKPSLCGCFTALADALKLLSKELVIPSSASANIVTFSACLLFCVSNILMWGYYSAAHSAYLSSHAVFLLALLSLPVFGVMGIGWGSNSKYSILGGTRAIAQTISYEVSFAVLILCLLCNSGLVLWCRSSFGSGLVHVVVLVLLFTSALAETNRSPFDIVEGESELVSGFNVETRSSLFTLIFIAEYMSILFQSALLSFLLTRSFGSMRLGLLVFLSFTFIWVRGTLPRFRYDQLMSLCWKSFLPFSLSYFCLVLLL